MSLQPFHNVRTGGEDPCPRVCAMAVTHWDSMGAMSVLAHLVTYAVKPWMTMEAGETRLRPP
eukprot:4049526-Amphidinium_carterae.1